MNRQLSVLDGISVIDVNTSSSLCVPPGVKSTTDPLFWQVACGDSENQVTLDAPGCLAHAAMWRGVKLISDVLQKIPFHVLKNNPEGGSEKDTAHESFQLLRNVADRRKQIGAGTWKSTMAFHAVFWGNAFSWIQRERGGRPIALVPLPPDSVHRRTVKIAGRRTPVYTVTFDDEDRRPQTRDIFLDNMFHLKTLSYDGVWGEPFWRYAKEACELGTAARRHGRRFFSNGATPTAIVRHPVGWEPDTANRFKDSFKEAYQGLGNANTVVILEDGIGYEQLQIPNDAAQFIESRQFSNKEIALYLGLNPHAVGDTTSVSYNSLEMQLQHDLEFAFDPWLVRFEEEANLKLLRPKQLSSGSHKCEFRREAFVRTDTKTKNEGVGGLYTNQIITKNEARTEFNLPAVPGGDEFKVSVSPIQTQKSPETDDSTSDNDLEAARFCMHSAANNVLRELKQANNGQLISFSEETPTRRAERINNFATICGASMRRIDQDEIDEAADFYVHLLEYLDVELDKHTPDINKLADRMRDYINGRAIAWQ